MLMKQMPVVGTQPTGREGHKTARHPRALHPGYFKQLRVMGARLLIRLREKGRAGSRDHWGCLSSSKRVGSCCSHQGRGLGGGEKGVPTDQGSCSGVDQGPFRLALCMCRRGQEAGASGESLARDTVHRPCSPPPPTLNKPQFSHQKSRGHCSSCHKVRAQEAAAESKPERLVMSTGPGELPEEGSRRKGREG